MLREFTISILFFDAQDPKWINPGSGSVESGVLDQTSKYGFGVLERGYCGVEKISFNQQFQDLHQLLELLLKVENLFVFECSLRK